MKKILLFICICCVAQMCFVTTPCKGEEKEKRISIDFEQVPLGSVLRVLTAKTGRKFITDTELSSKKIVLHLKSITPDEALDALLDTYNLYYVRQRETNIYVIKSKDKGKITTVSKIFYCSYAKSKELVEVLKTKLTSGGDLSADERTNAVVVTDMADNVDKIGFLIEELDSPTPQVFLEVKIIDMKIGQTIDAGMNLNILHEDGEDTKKYEQDLNPKKENIFGKYTVGIIENDYDIDAIIEAVVSKSDAKVLSNPKLIVLNNQEATIEIVDEIPYTEVTQTDDGGSMTSTEFKKVGVLLKVKPLINKDGTIIINIMPEQSFQTGASASNIPIVNVSKANTTLMLQDEETAVIGGLIRETNSVTENKVPILGDIPIIGYLFKKVDTEKTRKELTIFVTARIIEGYY